MKSISTFFTIYWCLYFPTCIAYNELPGFSSVDEVMTVILIGYTFMMKGSRWTNHQPWKEFFIFFCVLAFYIVYSLSKQVNVPGAVWLELVQQIRPYSVIFCTWILNPQFTRKQKKIMLATMIVTLFSWIIYHPQTLDATVEAEFPVLGQLAICTGMAYYLFTKETKLNRYIALALVCTGFLAPKMKFVGEVVCFVALLFFIKRQLDFRSPRTMVILSVLIALCIMFTWTRFDAYYVTGWNEDWKARPMMYKTSLKILQDYIPFGPGMGTFGTLGSWRCYSPLYYKYDLNGVWGLNEGGGFICDAFYPTLAQYGIVGVVLFCIFWKRRIKEFTSIKSMRYYRVAMMAFFCLAIESMADSSYLSGKGMGYFMLLGLCLNANLNMIRYKEKTQDVGLLNRKILLIERYASNTAKILMQS